MAKKDKDGKAPPPPAEAEDDAAAQRRVAFLRHKLTQAMDDPLRREQIVAAIRSMMIEDK